MNYHAKFDHAKPDGKGSTKFSFPVFIPVGGIGIPCIIIVVVVIIIIIIITLKLCLPTLTVKTVASMLMSLICSNYSSVFSS